MANASAHRQRHTAPVGAHLQSWPPPGGYSAPAIIEVARGRQRRTGPQPGRPTQSPRGTPAPIPPHPPLISGGWYRSLARSEVAGPGRYPLRSPADKSVGAALALGAVLGPAGLCYTSLTAGLVAIGLTAITLILAGFASLLVIWPLSMVAAALAAQQQHRWFERQ